MKGKTLDSCRAMATGGKVRNLGGGITAPRYGEDKAVMKEAEGKTTGIVKMDVEGHGARPRMDRPGRKFGGRMVGTPFTKERDMPHKRDNEAEKDSDDKAEFAKGGRVKHGKHREGHEHHEEHHGRKHEAHGGFLSGLKKGALRRELHVPEGDNIPEKKLRKAEHSASPLERKRARLAETMKHWKKG